MNIIKTTTYFVFLEDNKIPYAHDMNFHHSIPSHKQFEQVLETDNSIYLHNRYIGDIVVAKTALIRHNTSFKTWTA